MLFIELSRADVQGRKGGKGVVGCGALPRYVCQSKLKAIISANTAFDQCSHKR